MTWIYEMGKAEPVGWVEEIGMTSGSSTCVGGVSVYGPAWKCYYCGSMHDRDKFKCPNCGAEKRDTPL